MDSDQNRDSKELVLLIHGTGSACDLSSYPSKDPGQQRWWQRDSLFWQQFDKLLSGSKVSLPVEGFWQQFDPIAKEKGIDHFWWSGANSERARRDAASRLWNVIWQLQQKNIVVHLIGHSHGGSVIRQAIVYGKAKAGGNLRNIGSVSSVGTPFIGFRPHPWGWIWIAVAIAMIMAFRLPLVAVRASVLGLTPDPTLNFQWSNLFSAGWWYRLTSRWPESIAQEHNPLTFVPLPLCLIFASVFIIFFIRWLWQWLITRANETRLKALAEEYAPKWKVIYSRHDEAINGLILMDRVQLNRVTPRFGNWFYDPLIAPQVDQFITETIRDSALGADCTGEFAGTVHTSIVSSTKTTVEPLDVQVDQAILDKANFVAQDTVVRLRKMLSNSAKNVGSKFTEGTLSNLVMNQVLSSTNTELVHNQYFECAEVREELAKHIMHPAPSNEVHQALISVDRYPYWWSRIRIVLFSILLSLCPLASFLFVDGRVDFEAPIVVASKDFDESEIMGEILAQKLRLPGKGSFPNAIYRFTDYTSREVLQRASLQDVHVYLEYTGSLYRWMDASTFTSTGNGAREVDPEFAPRFSAEGSLNFNAWFRNLRAENRQLVTFEAGESLGFSSPYVLTIKRGPTEEQQRKGEETLFKKLLDAGVITTIAPERRNQWQTECPGIRVDYQLRYKEFVKWIKSDKAPTPIRFQLTQSLLTNDSGIRNLLATMNDSKLERIKWKASLHDEMFDALRRGNADFVDAYGTDPEMFVSDEQPEFCGLDIAELDVKQRKLMGEVMIPYEGFALVSRNRRAERNALIAALRRPLNTSNPMGKINQRVFVELLQEFHQMLSNDSALAENKSGERDLQRTELVKKYWDRLFVLDTDSGLNGK